jgi:hypothetical protein
LSDAATESNFIRSNGVFTAVRPAYSLKISYRYLGNQLEVVPSLSRKLMNTKDLKLTLQRLRDILELLSISIFLLSMTLSWLLPQRTVPSSFGLFPKKVLTRILQRAMLSLKAMPEKSS